VSAEAKTCPSCGMPAPPATDTCGFCGLTYGSPAPASYRLVATGTSYHWLAEDLPVLEASWAGGMWHLRETGQDRVALTLLAVAHGNTTRVALVDDRARLAATITPAPAATGNIGIVRDRHERVLFLVRSDGPTGVHVIDTEGNVVALASRSAGSQGIGLDVLVTRPGVRRQELVLFAVTLALELIRAGELRPVA